MKVDVAASWVEIPSLNKDTPTIDTGEPDEDWEVRTNELKLEMDRSDAGITELIDVMDSFNDYVIHTRRPLRWMMNPKQAPISRNLRALLLFCCCITAFRNRVCFC